MKRILFFAWAGFLVAAALSSCSLFKLDNYDAPEETLNVKVVDVATGNPVLTETSSNGIRIRLVELSFGDNPTPKDYYCSDDGTYHNTKIFKGNYNVRVDGPFIPIVRETADGELIEDGSVTTDIKGTTNIEFKVQPFLNVEIGGEPVVSGGQITAQVKVTRAVSRDEFREKVEPMGGYSDAMANVTDVRLYVSYSNTLGAGNSYSSWNGVNEYAGASFEDLLDKPVTIHSNGTIRPGRKVFIRAAARINYGTPAGTGNRRYNYSAVKEVNIP